MEAIVSNLKLIHLAAPCVKSQMRNFMSMVLPALREFSKSEFYVHEHTTTQDFSFTIRGINFAVYILQVP